MKTLKEIMAKPEHFHSRSQVTGIVGAIVMLRIDKRVRLINDCIRALESDLHVYRSLPKPVIKKGQK